VAHKDWQLFTIPGFLTRNECIAFIEQAHILGEQIPGFQGFIKAFGFQLDCGMLVSNVGLASDMSPSRMSKKDEQFTAELGSLDCPFLIGGLPFLPYCLEPGL
jgi:hypothetical protein